MKLAAPGKKVQPEPLDLSSRALNPKFSGLSWRSICTFVFVLALLTTIPTVGDFGLTWDEPAYRFSQIRSAQWWERLAAARSVDEVRPLVEPDALLFYWTYTRHGINFHPPLAGQLNLLSHAVFGRWMRDIPARRMAPILEFALTATLGFVFLGRRYGLAVGAVAAGSFLLMPRLYGQAHLIETDITGLLLWVAISLAFWKGLYEPNSRPWRILVGILLGLAFVEKMAAVFVIVPLLFWLGFARLPNVFRRGSRADWIDGALTTTALLAPLALAFVEILRLSKQLPQPMRTDLLYDSPKTQIPGLILAVPLAVWFVRRAMARVFPGNPVWGMERPALEIWAAILAFAPAVGWIGNPSWWRETLPRFAHYYLLNTDRRGSLPDIQIIYFGQVYEYSLPWHSAWVLIAITVPALTLFASLIGVLWAFGNAGKDKLPVYFLLQLLALPVFRMLPTPGHDGVRLFLPTFFFLSAFAGWGTAGVANGLARLLPTRPARWASPLLATLVLATSGRQLVQTHPFELSYYNELIGGPRGAWQTGFELSYWYDAFNPKVIDELNDKLPAGAVIDFMNPLTEPSTFHELRTLGKLRGDVVLSRQSWDTIPYAWLLTQDSKATDFTRFLFVMKPWYEVRPRQLDHARVAAVADPTAVARAWFLSLLVPVPDTLPPDSPVAPNWVHDYAPFLGRLWGEGLTMVRRPLPYEPIFDWARTDPESLRESAKRLAREKTSGDDPAARRLMSILSRTPKERPGMYAELLLRVRPEALIEAIEMVIRRPDAVRQVASRYAYTDPDSIGGPLDQDLGSMAR